MTEQIKSEAQIAYLNRILRAIRNVNQLLVREQDQDRLLQGTCELLIETGGYHHAWIALVDEEERWTLAAAAGAGLDREFAALRQQLAEGGTVYCLRQLMAPKVLAPPSEENVQTIAEPRSLCSGCPLSERYEGRMGMIVSLRHNKRIYGALTVSVAAEFAAGEEGQVLLNEIAGDIALALHRLEVEQARQQGAREGLLRFAEGQKALYAVTSAASSSLDPETLLDNLLDAILPLLNSTAGWVTLPGPTLDDPPRLVAHRGLDPHFIAAEESYPLRDCPVCAPLLTGGEAQVEPMLCAQCPRLSPQIMAEANLYSHVGIPLTARDQVLGVLNIAWESPNPYTQQDHELLTSIGRQMGMALRNAQLYQKAHQVDRLRVLNELNQALAATLDPDEMAEITLHRLAAAVDAPLGALFTLPDPETLFPARVLTLSRGWIEMKIPVQRWLERPTPWQQSLWQDLREKAFRPLRAEELGFLTQEHLPQVVPRWGEHGLLVPALEADRPILVLALGGRQEPFTEEDQALMRAAVTHAAQFIQNAWHHQALVRTESLLAEAQQIAHLGSWEWQVASGELRWSDEVYRIFGVSPDTFEATYENFLQSVHPDDREKVIRAVELALNEGQPYDIKHRILRPDGEERVVREKAQVRYNAQGQPQYMIGTAQDITEQAQMAERLSVIYRLGQELTLLHDETVIIQKTLQAAAQVLRCNFASYGEVDKATAKFRYRRILVDGNWRPGTLVLPLDSDRGIGVAVAQSGRAINIPDTAQEPRYLPYGDRANRFELCVPIRVEGRVLGVLNVERNQQGPFTTADEQLLQTLADQIAVALENARLYRQAQEQAEHLIVLNAIGTAITSSLDMKTVIARLLEMTCQALDAGGGSILLRDPDTDELVFAQTTDGESRVLRGRRLARGVGIAGWVMEHRQSVQVDDVRQDPRFYDGLDKVTGMEIRSLLCVPFGRPQGASGVIEIVNKRDGTFNQQDLKFLESIAPAAAVALENARLYQDLQDQMQALQETQQMLIRSEKLAALGHLAASLTHEINNPLQSVIGCLGLAQESLDAGEEEDLAEYLTIAHNEVRRVARIVARMRDLGRPRSREVQKEEVEINALLSEALALVWKRCKEQGIEIAWEPDENLPTLVLDADQIKQVFLNLLLNAIEVMPEGGLLRVTTHTDDERHGVQIEIADTGPGISAAALPYIFEPFYSTKEQGMGLGLAISQRIAHEHGGDIQAVSQVGEGTTFRLWLPAGEK